jgi:TetR/AcrR family transcriptional repressor of uid operon
VRTVDPARRAEKQREILAAAIRCFIKHGFHGSSMSVLCAEAGMSPGHLYHYFASKEAIIEAMVAANLEDARRRFAEAAGGSDSTLNVILAQLGEDTSKDEHRQPLLFDMLAEAARNTVIKNILDKHSRGMESLLAELLRRGQAEGAIDTSLNPDLVAPLLISLSDGSKSLALRNSNLSSYERREMLRKLLTKFLRSQEVRCSRPA